MPGGSWGSGDNLGSMYGYGTYDQNPMSHLSGPPVLVPERRCNYSNTFSILRIISYVPTYSITICMYLYEDTQDGKGHRYVFYYLIQSCLDQA